MICRRPGLDRDPTYPETQAAGSQSMPNVLLDRAAHTKPATTKRGALERLFTMMFKGFVYNQIWEDPDVDLEALAIKPHHTLITIASGGCNVLNYLAADPERIIAVDLNPNHVALTRLKLAALANLPSYEDFFRFFGTANDKENRKAFDNFLSTRLDPVTRRYWEKQIPLHGRRINMFARNLYKYGLLGRFIGVLHAVARLHGKKLNDIVEARTPAEQRRPSRRRSRRCSNTSRSSFCRNRPSRFTRSAFRPRNMTNSWRRRPTAIRSRFAPARRKLACDFPIHENYFAWQAFTRGYDVENREAVPAYLQSRYYDVIRTRTNRVEVHHASLIDFLKTQKPNSIHRYVLLDAQDWMTPGCARSTLGADRPHGRHPRRARDLPHRGRYSPLPRKLPAACWRRGNIRRRKAGSSTPRTGLRSTAASICIAAGLCPRP